MKNNISPDEAHGLWNKYLSSEQLRNHSLQTSAIMRRLAAHFGEDPDDWATAGLLHDLDMDIVEGDPERHGLETIDILKKEGYDCPEMFHAILTHTEGFAQNRPARSTTFEYALAAAESITGIITAYVLVRPDKKIAGTQPKSITKKLKDKSFAASVNRAFINDIEKTGLERSHFIQMSIDALTEIAEEIGM